MKELDPGTPTRFPASNHWNFAGTDIEIIWDLSNDEKVTLTVFITV